MTTRKSGQAMVEFAMVLGILMLLIFGAICALQILMTQYTVAQAARTAAHQAALIGGDDGTNGTVRSIARTILDGGMGTSSSNATISIICRDAGGRLVTQCRRYYSITVRVEYIDTPWVPIGPFTQVHADISATRAAERDQQ